MSEAHRLKLAEMLQSAPLNNIPAKLREMADQYEKGELIADAMVIAYSAPDGSFRTVGLASATENYKAYYMFCCAQRSMEANSY